MAYSADSFTAGEQPTTAKWNKLWSNDASFNDGTGIANLAWNVTSLSNPYKFLAYRNSAQTINTGALRQINFDSEIYDTNGNFDSSTNFRYTAPVAGFYDFKASIAITGAAAVTRLILELFINGSDTYRLGDSTTTSSTANAVNGAAQIQLSASDTVDVRVQPVGANAVLDVGTSPYKVWFAGRLASRT